MKRIIGLSLVTISLAASSAFAKSEAHTFMSDDIETLSPDLQEDVLLSEYGVDTNTPGQDEACKKIALTDEQKTQIKEAVTIFMNDAKALKDAAKQSGVAYKNELSNPNATEQSANAASDTHTADIAKIISRKFALKNHIFIGILTPEQRPAAMACAHHIKGIMLKKAKDKICSK